MNARRCLIVAAALWPLLTWFLWTMDFFEDGQEDAPIAFLIGGVAGILIVAVAWPWLRQAPR